MGLLLVFASISIIFSFLCSIWEAALLSITHSFVEQKRKEGGKTGKLLKRFKENIDQPLSAILTLNTIAHTAGAIGVGAMAGQAFGAGNIHFLGYELPFSAEAMIGTLMTLAILILSEIIPKTLGANYWRMLAPFTVKSLEVIIWILWPLVWLSQIITKRLKKEKGRSIFSRADFTAMAEIGEKEGIFQQNESRIIQNLLRFHTIDAQSIMTPRTVIQAADLETKIEDFFHANKLMRFSRIPVYKDNKDNIEGFVLKDEILASIINGNGDAPLKQIKRDIMIIGQKFPLPELFDKMLEKREQIAMVVDDFGGLAGIVTMEDVIETLLGMEIVDELDGTEDMQLLARENWEKRAQQLGLFTQPSDGEDE
ncbi:MAG: hypothetical protein DHS20C18_15400 [Saprospiraceae bacterium]|nr:MAG: hypothetical protein DHS20C18_15400 [Saprospiraceae bacterium]